MASIGWTPNGNATNGHDSDTVTARLERARARAKAREEAERKKRLAGSGSAVSHREQVRRREQAERDRLKALEKEKEKKAESSEKEPEKQSAHETQAEGAVYRLLSSGRLSRRLTWKERRLLRRLEAKIDSVRECMHRIFGEIDERHPASCILSSLAETEVVARLALLELPVKKKGEGSSES